MPALPPTRRLLLRGEAGYEAARRDAVWNARKPGRYPDRIVLAQTPADVAWAVRAAASGGLQVAVRSGGHSWYGNCLRDGQMLVDLSALNDVVVDPDALTAAVGPAVTGRRLDAALVAHDLFFPVGHCGSVGLGGFALGGGYGWNSRARGPACLSIRAIDVVLASGEHVHADDSNHPDLLWAARGSGPGFFGVVTRFYFDLCPRPRILWAGIVYPLEVHDEVLSWALELLPRLPHEVEMSARVGYSEVVGRDAVTLTAVAFAPAGASVEASELLAPLNSCPAIGRALTRTETAVEQLPDLHDRGIEGPPIRWDVDGIWTDAPSHVILSAARAAGLTRTPGEHSFVLWMFWGHHPVRGNACWSIQAPLYLSPNAGWEDPAEDRRQERWVDGALRSLAPYSRGVQFSDANLAVRAGEGLSPANARRLEEIRRVYDPRGLFASPPVPIGYAVP
jgi:FAD/FMN-containing dehydrogenase